MIFKGVLLSCLMHVMLTWFFLSTTGMAHSDVTGAVPMRVVAVV